MMRLLTKLFGFVLMLLGIYFLSKNIVLTAGCSHAYYYFRSWCNISSKGTIITLLGGIISFLFFRRETGSLGWILIAISIVLVAISGILVWKATTLWYLFLAFTALFGGYKMFTSGSARF
jgi:hypothetical protein